MAARNPDLRGLDVVLRGGRCSCGVAGARVQGDWYNTSDISAVLQEVLDQATRAPGDAVAFMLSSTSGHDAYFSAWDHGDHSGAP